ncbi:MAG TPA: hypothetical protein VFH08_19750 [Chitinophagaceae bacterium]|nr:hypothetical protein [Chitinophagaceae bacterium]
MEDNEKFSVEQSLQVIQAMIQKVKQDVANNSFYLLLWGWLIFIAALLNFGLMKFTRFEQPYLAWNLMWIGAVATVIKGVRDSKKIKVKTFVGETMKVFGISQAILYFGLAFFFGKYDLWTTAFPLYILVYAATCFFMGALIQFSLLKWTGLLCLPIMVIAAYVSFDWQLLLMALAILISYIIPGHVLSVKEKIQNK